MNALEALEKKYGGPVGKPAPKPEPKPKTAPWRDVPEVREFFDFLQELRDDGMHVQCGIKDGDVILQFNPMPEQTDDDWWTDYSIACELFLETAPHIRQLMKKGKLRLMKL